MSDLVRYQGGPLSLSKRRAAAEVREAQRPARRSVARLGAAARVAHVGMVNIELLTGLEAQMSRRQGATVDARASAVVDVYSSLVASELVRLGLEE